jgi:RNA polymerase sigma factor (sigma-70 family)
MENELARDVSQKPIAPPAPRTWTDLELLTRVLSRDPRAWVELVRRFRAVIRHCVKQTLLRHGAGLASSADVEDVHADVLVALLHDDMRRLRLWRPQQGARLGTWLGTIARNTAYDRLRADRRRLAGSGACDLGPATPAPADAFERLISAERRERVTELLGRLTDKDRAFFALYYRQELDAAEVAARMNVSVDAVYSWKHKLCGRLRATLSRAPQSVHME